MELAKGLVNLYTARFPPGSFDPACPCFRNLRERGFPSQPGKLHGEEPQGA